MNTDSSRQKFGIGNKKGVTLVISLLVITMITSLSSIYIMRAVQESSMSKIEVNSAKALYAAEAGGNEGLLTLYNLINFYMLNTVSSTSPTVIASQASSYASSHNGVGLLVAYVKNGTTPLLTQVSNEAVYTGTATSLDNGTYSYTIRIGPEANPSSPAANIWDFPFYFKIQVTATNTGLAKKTILNGDFTVRVQKDNFARYALFTNHHTMQDGSTVWFSNMTHFTGPLFTDDRFSFANNPSGTFNGTVKQVSQQARFYNNNSPVLLDADSNGTRDVPTFNVGFQRGTTAITMPTASQESDMANQASGGNTYSSNGIYLPTTGSTLSGGIYVYGDANISMGTDAQDRQTITITRGSTTKIITMDRTANQTIVQGSSTNTYTGLPNGTSDVGTIIYVNGNINSIGGTVQRDNQMTIASHNDMIINDNIRYENRTPGSGTPGTSDYTAPSAEGTNNLLGLLSWNGNVRISSSAPVNVEIDATAMAKSGVVTVDNYDSIASRGTATILGGVISNYYGAFGTFNSSTGAQASGYGRNFVYDTRMETSMTPPYFPTTNAFIALTNNIGDHLAWQQGGF